MVKVVRLVIKKLKLDLGSIRSSLRVGLSTSKVHMRDMNLVLPKMNLPLLDAGILILMHCIK